MKLITLEEHFTPAIVPGIDLPQNGEPPLIQGTLLGAPWLTEPLSSVEIGPERLAQMDKDGVDMQILSTPFAQGFSADVSVDYCRKINDYLAEKIAEHPDRFAGFAAIPTKVPEACAAELERAITELGFVGCLISNRVGRDGESFLSEECYEPFLAKAEELGVPIYLHPGVPPREVVDACYGQGLSADVTSVFSRYGYGWHVDPGIHMMQLILHGVFDRHPRLQMILGHWGEILPYYMVRFDETMPATFTGLKHDPSYYLKNNMYVTPSGIFDPDAFEFCLKTLGADRIMFAIDYPFAPAEGKEKILEHPGLSKEDAEKIAYKNAEQLFRLK